MLRTVWPCDRYPPPLRRFSPDLATLREPEVGNAKWMGDEDVCRGISHKIRGHSCQIPFIWPQFKLQFNFIIS